MSSWTLDDLAALERAIAQGLRRVQYQDRSVEYRSQSDMLAARELIRKDLGLDSDTRPRLVQSRFQR